jgi:hypothetical protein
MKNISGGDNLAAYIGIDTKKSKKVKEVKEITPFIEEKVIWEKELLDLINKVEKSYENKPIKEKYDFMVSLITATNCIQ